MNAAGGGTVNLPGGYTFLTGDLTLKSNVTLNINANAVLKESQNTAHYAHSADVRQTEVRLHSMERVGR